MLLLGARRAAQRPHLAVGPGLFREPLDRVVAVFPGPDEVGIRALGVVATALVLKHDHVPIGEEARHVFREAIEHPRRQVRIAEEHSRHIVARRPFGKENERVEADAITHGHHRHVVAVGMCRNVGDGSGVPLGDTLGRR